LIQTENSSTMLFHEELQHLGIQLLYCSCDQVASHGAIFWVSISCWCRPWWPAMPQIPPTARVSHPPLLWDSMHYQQCAMRWSAWQAMHCRECNSVSWNRVKIWCTLSKRLNERTKLQHSSHVDTVANLGLTYKYYTGGIYVGIILCLSL
jgi:hypothetical protein